MASTSGARSVIVLPYDRVCQADAGLDQLIEAAYGPEGLGLLVISGVPGFVRARAALLPLASRLAALPPDALARLEDRASGYNFGWSAGKEQLEDSKPGMAPRFRLPWACRELFVLLADGRLAPRRPVEGIILCQSHSRRPVRRCKSANEARRVGSFVLHRALCCSVNAG